MRIARKTGLLSLLAVVATVLAAAIPQVASAETKGNPSPPPGGAPVSWISLQNQAAAAAASVRQAGDVNVNGVLSPPTQRPAVQLAGGTTVSSVDEIVSASDPSGAFQMDLDLLGGQQLVVSLLGPSATVLVLTPGTSTVAETDLTQGTPSVSSDVLHADSLQCTDVAYDPIVIGSIFGPLIASNVVGMCSSPATIQVSGSVIEWVYGSKTIGSSGGAIYGTYYSLNAYAQCIPISWYSYFQSGVLVWINGGAPFGGTSPWVPLTCRLL